ncbi:MAG: TetR/AcrR family transcriptional regulator, partial [Oscillospiraceae bacterium]
MRATKDLIIETTIKLIQSAGSDPEQVTVRDISKQAGIAVSQINYHFASKENLIAICVQRMIGDVISLFGDALKQVNDLSSFEKL